MTTPIASPPIFFPAPAELLGWTHGAVAACLPADAKRSHFPATVDGMLVFRTQGQVYGFGQSRPLRALALIGPSATPRVFTHADAVCAYGLLLAPHTVSFLSGQPNGSTSGQDLCLRSLLPEAAGRLFERMPFASNDAARCQVLFDWLRERLSQSDAAQVTRWSKLAELAPLLLQGLDVACAELGVGPRQLERLTRQHLGMTPHRARTILRMQATLRSAMAAVKAPDGADLALSQGFFDQSHMNRDLKRLAGLPLGRAVTASRDATGAEWPLTVGRQQLNLPERPDVPGTTAERTKGPIQNTSTHTAIACAPDPLAPPKR